MSGRVQNNRQGPNAATRRQRAAAARLAGDPRAPARAIAEGVKSELHVAGLDLMPYFGSMMDPDSYDPHRVPDGHPGTTAVFKSPMIRDLPYSGTWDAASGMTITDTVDQKGASPINGYSEVIIGPGTKNSVFYTLGSDDPVIIRNLGPNNPDLIPCLTSHPQPGEDTLANGETALVHGLRLSGGDGGNQYAILPKKDSDGLAWFEMDIVPVDPIGGTLLIPIILNNLNATRNGSKPVTAHFHWALSNNVIAIPREWRALPGTIFLVQIGLPPDEQITKIAVTVEDSDPSSHWTFSLIGNPTLGVVMDPLEFDISLKAFSVCNFRVEDAPELAELSQTQSERTTALSGLCTYMGSTLADGGQISTARLGMGLSPLRAPEGDVYSYLASLPMYCDDGPLRDGIYSWWLPDSIQEFFYKPYLSPRTDFIEDNSVIQYAMTRDDPTQGVRLEVIQNIEVITRSRLYSVQVAPVNPSFDMVYSVLKHAPSSCENPEHKSIMRRAWSGIKNWISKPNNWVKLLRGGAKAIQTLAPLIAVM